MGLLGDQGDGAAGHGRTEFGRRYAPDQHGPGGGRLNARHEPGQGGLARAARADESHPLARPDRQVHVVQDGVPGPVGVPDTAHGDLGAARAGRAGRWLRHRLVGDAHQTGQARRRGLGVVEQDQGRVDRGEQTVEVQGGGGRRADGRRALADQPVPGEQDGGQPDVLGDVQAAVEAQDQPHALHGQRDHGRGPFGDPSGVLPLQPERPYGGHARDGVEELLLLGPRGHPLLRVERHRAGHVPAGGGQLHGHGQQRGQQEPPVEQGHGTEGEHDGQQRTDQFRQGVAHGLRDEGHIGGDPGGEIARAGLLDPLQRQPQGPFDELLAQPGQRGLAQPGDQRQAVPGAHALRHGDGRQQGRGGGERVDGPAVGGQVDDPAQQWLHQQADRGGTDHDGQRGQRETALRPQQSGDRGTGARGRRDGQQRGGGARCFAGLGHASTAVR